MAFIVLLFAASSAAGPSGDAPPVPVVVCASHHEVLRYWLEAAANGNLARSGVSVVHFDGHPDLAVPARPIQRAWRDHPGALVHAVDIASFQIAAAWLGLIDRVVWLRPTWARQLPDGERRFRIGRDANGLLRVDDSSDYYVLDRAWAPTASLRDPVELDLRVLPLPDAAPGTPLANGDVILDIDLDGFATRNPAADRLRRAGLGDESLATIRRAFDRERLALADDPERRRVQLGELIEAVESLGEPGLVAPLGGAWTLWRLGVGVQDLWALQGVLAEIPASLPFERLAEDARMLVGLPEHEADRADVATTLGQIEDLLREGAVRPRLVTIARSVRDGYTPREAWPALERALLDSLARSLTAIDVRYDRGLRVAPADTAPPPSATSPRSSGASP